jgi:RNA polymerase sigma factor (sigma-70 family)
MQVKQADARRAWVLSALEQHESELVRYAQRFVGDLHAARDVVQHAFLRLCDQDPRELRGREAAWLYRVCRNRALDWLRQAGRLQPFDESEELAFERTSASEASDPALLAERGELSDVLRSLVARLPLLYREPLQLWSQGWSYREIAAVVERTEGNVRVLVHRAVKALKEHPQVMAWQAEGVRG